MKNFPLLLNFVATLPCKTNASVNVRVKLWRFCVPKIAEIRDMTNIYHTSKITCKDYETNQIVSNKHRKDAFTFTITYIKHYYIMWLELLYV